MTNILKQFEQSRDSQFLPSSPDEYFAVRLATGLGEPEAAHHYSVLASRYSQHKLLSAYEHAVLNKGGNSAAKVFHDYLASLPEGGSNGIARPRLMAVRIERRCMGAGVFIGTHLEGFCARVLAADYGSGETSAISFLRSSLSENECQAIAIETADDDTRRSKLHRAIVTACREDGVSVWEIPIANVMAALSHPPPKSREKMRKQVQKMWPLTDLRKKEECTLDAFALGLYVQTERLFGSDHLNGH